MYGWDPDEEPTGESYRRTPPRRIPPRSSRPREAFDAARGGEHPAASAARPATGNRGRSGRRFLRSARRRVGSALAWVGALVIAPLLVGVLAGAVAEHIHL